MECMYSTDFAYGFCVIFSDRSDVHFEYRPTVHKASNTCNLTGQSNKISSDTVERTRDVCTFSAMPTVVAMSLGESADMAI